MTAAAFLDDVRAVFGEGARIVPRKGVDVSAGRQAEHRLVRGSKLSTAHIEAWNEVAEHYLSLNTREPVFEAPDETDTGKYLTVMCEPWRAIEHTPEGLAFTPLNAERAPYRVTRTVETLTKWEPPLQEGDRWTEAMSPRGAKGIESSALYLARMKRGYTTFLTLTLTTEQRAQLAAWDEEKEGTPGRESIGSMVRGFLNTIKERYKKGIYFAPHYMRAGKQQRGGKDAWTKSAAWTPVKLNTGFHMRAHGKPFAYCWVAENPKNKAGQDNPHIHIMLNWSVKKTQFHAWARWIEKSWGRGYAKLERLRKPESAGAYMAKAARYVTKGSDGTQGKVRGNRFFISSNARAPKPRLVAVLSGAWESLRDAFHLGQAAAMARKGRGEKPLAWFTEHAFGVNNRTDYLNIMQALKNDGMPIKHAPMGYLVARFTRHASAIVERWAGMIGHAWLDLPAPLEYSGQLTIDDMEAIDSYY